MLYKFIEEMSDDLALVKNSSLSALSQIWLEQESRLTKTNALIQFNEKIKRQWAIETGIIENLYTLDRGITVLLVEQGIHEALIPHYASNRSTRELVQILSDHKNSIDGIFNYVKGNRDLSISFIKELHQSLTTHQSSTQAIDMFGKKGEIELIRGDWKIYPNNPLREDGTMHEYCPPEHVQTEMEMLIKLYNEYSQVGVSTEILAAWLHHRFTQIHPFQDGNGRVARAIATLVFIKHKWFPLVIDREQRVQYITALELADQGDLNPLIDLFSENQKNYFIKALSISEDVISTKSTIDQIIKSAVRRIEKSKQEIEKEKENAIIVTNKIFQYISGKMESLKIDLESNVMRIDPKIRIFYDLCSAGHELWYKYNVIAIAKELGFFANFAKYSNWARFRILSSEKFDTLISAVSVGDNYNGVIAFVAFVLIKTESDESSQDYQILNLSPELFIVNYNEDSDSSISRFEKWYNEVISKSLTEWQRNL
jgi:Fic family protein